jgi:Tol biopolymer transport system component
MRKLILLLLLGESVLAHSQLPETDIYLSDIRTVNNQTTFTDPVNITHHKGYDNQPCFSPDGKKILFVSVQDTTQSDVYVYDIALRTTLPFTFTPVSEYSPAYTPDKKFISVVRVDADSGQRFYLLPVKTPEKARAVANTDSIGYACWINDSLLAMFILGPSNTLQLLNTTTGERKLVASDIGRCMKLSPDKRRMYFILKSNEKEWFVYAMDVRDFSLSRLAPALEGSEDFAILPDGTLLMGAGSKLFALKPGTAWTLLRDFSASFTGFYRIAVDEKGKRLALVAYTGKKP